MSNFASVRPRHLFRDTSYGLLFVWARWAAERTRARTALAVTAVLMQSLVLPSVNPFGPLRARAAEVHEEPVGAGSATVAADDEAEREPESVIVAGQEAMLGAMVGEGATLPGQCAFDRGDVNRTVIKSTYKCPGGEVVFELRHPDKAPAGATQTAKFAITLQSGSPPPGLLDALVALIRSREAAFEWKQTVVTPPKGALPVRSKRLSVLLLIAVGLLGVAGVRQALRRSRKA